MEPSLPFTSTLPGAVMRAFADNAFDLVLAEEEFDALGELAHHLVLLRHHGGQIELDLALMPSLAKSLSRFMETLAGVQQRLGRDAADIEAGAAEGCRACPRRPP